MRRPGRKKHEGPGLNRREGARDEVPTFVGHAAASSHCGAACETFAVGRRVGCCTTDDHRTLTAHPPALFWRACAIQPAPLASAGAMAVTNATSAAVLAMLCTGLAAAAIPAPWDWRTVPVFAETSNVTGPFDAEAMSTLARFRLFVGEKVSRNNCAPTQRRRPWPASPVPLPPAASVPWTGRRQPLTTAFLRRHPPGIRLRGPERVCRGQTGATGETTARPEREHDPGLLLQRQP